ncbi:MAG: hypothetical protein E7Z92_07780 [Cyanobacteria bacterium SIG31]|nr:hypothetical protein [Cyanobacteria bacterium SIG31]
MKISPINNNQTSFKAVNQKYYEWAKKEMQGTKDFGELLTQLRYRVVWGDIHPQDGIDTIEAIKKLIGDSGDFIEHVLQNFKELLKN